MRGILPFLIILLAVAFFTKADFFFYLLYALFGIYTLGRAWARSSLGAVRLERRYDRRLFLGQTAPIELRIHNRSWLPVLWLRLTDSLPAKLAPPSGGLRHVVSLLPHERISLAHTLYARHRGYHPFGPLLATSGDLLGTGTFDRQAVADDFVIVYPKIIPLRDLGFPSQSPFGVLPCPVRIFEDPTRIQGVRNYQPGDPLKRMDWKTSARVGGLQVRRYEPAISRETAIFLNLNPGDYAPRERFTATELGIIVAASVAVHMAEKRQSVSLVTNGLDPLQTIMPPRRAGQPAPEVSAAGQPPDAAERVAAPALAPGLPLRKGREHLMHLLDLLARIEVPAAGDALPFVQLLARRSLNLPWGSTVLAITTREVEGLMDTLMALRRRGLVVILVLTAPDRAFETTARRASQIGVRAVRVWSEQDLDVWR
jgi:uncharacterized protein (DUF58 family)